MTNKTSQNIVQLPAPENTPMVETGVIQFGEDWPGVFIRGDNAAAYAMAIESVLNNECDPMNEITLKGLQELLSGSNV